VGAMVRLRSNCHRELLRFALTMTEWRGSLDHQANCFG
ncbi:MAG: hypothetical protein ACI9R7_001881, partial [Lysobacterales bacterium]